MEPHEKDEARGRSARTTWILIGFLAVAAYFLFSEHRAHFIYYLPFVLLAACPLMHMFHGHGGHGTHGDASTPKRDSQAPAVPPDHRNGGSR